MKYANKKVLLDIYDKLYSHFGPQHWWPGKTPFEVMVGAILTQNTAWSNVEKAIANLRKEKLLSPQEIERIPYRSLRALIRPSGFYNEKAKKLKEFVRFLFRFCKGNIVKLRSYSLKILRKELLCVKGIGSETADSIILYALNRPIFVVDVYTKRVFSRHKLISNNAGYDEIQKFFMDNLPKKITLFNEYHALIVKVGKSYCKKSDPLCESCPLKMFKYSKDMV